MRFLIQLIIVYRTGVSFTLAALLSIWMIQSGVALQAKTARILAFSVFYPVQVSVEQIRRAKNIYSENERLKRAMAELSMQVALLQDEHRENTRLRGMLSFSETHSFAMVAARVVSRDPSSVYKSIVVNAGTRQGVEMWMPVVSEGGVVGKVVMAAGNLSLVQLLKDPLNRTSIMNRRSRAVSILETENGKNFFIRFRMHEDVVPGDTVVTSGMGGIYPRGFSVGTVTAIVDNKDPLFKLADITPTCDFDHLEEVFIVKLSPQWASFKVELDSLGEKQ